MNSLERGYHVDPNLRIDKIINKKAAQDSSFLSNADPEDNNEVIEALTLILKFLKNLDTSNNQMFELILENQKKILEQQSIILKKI